MSLIKYIERARLIHELIANEHTGTSKAFARKVGISRSVLMDHINELRTELNAPVVYCRSRKTFYYADTFLLEIKIMKNI